MTAPRGTVRLHRPADDVLCSFESVELLRRDQRLGRNRAAEALTTALTALLDRP